MRRLMFLLCLAAASGWADDLRCVDFTAPGGVKCRLTAEGSQMWRLRTADADGRFAEVGAVQALARWMGETMPVSPQPIREATANGIRTFTSSDGSKAVLAADGSTLAFFSATGRKVLEVDSVQLGAKGCVLGGRLLEKEAVYGLGERLDRLNKRGHRLTLYTSDGYNNSAATYAVIPLFSTTRGGGVFVNAYERMTADFGAAKTDAWRVEIEKPGLDAYFIATDRMRDVPARYMTLAGKPSVPDDWQFGPVVCRYSPDYAAVEGPVARPVRGTLTFGMGMSNIVERYREMGSMPTAIVAEGRGTAQRWREPEEFRRGPKLMAKDSIRYMIYMAMGSVITTDAPGYKKDYEVEVTISDCDGKKKPRRTRKVPFIISKNGNPDVSSRHSGSSKLDITDPEAWQWYLDQVWQPLLDDGVRGAKIDFCEEMPDEGLRCGNIRVNYHWKHPEVFDGAAVHHAYPSFFIAKLCRDLSARLEARGQGRFMALSRGGGIGVHRAPFMWAGDQQRLFQKLDDHVFAMLNAGVSGMPFMTYDMSGYHYSRPVATPYAVLNRKTGAIDLSRTAAQGPDEAVVHRLFSGEVSLDEEQRIFARGTEFTAYSACMQTHGYVRHPFEFDEATRKTYVAYAARHRALAPEILAASRKAAQKGIPVVRPLVWDYQDDENTWNIEDEYLFCDRYLVAPVLTDVTARDIYLPQGAWKDLTTGERHVVPAGGKRFRLDVPIDRIPVFAREPSLADGVAESS